MVTDNSRNNPPPRSRRGSVLMEFVVVMPLYCALLGGLFFLGELSVNRIRLQVGDQVGTVLAATRLMKPTPGMERDPIVDLLGRYVFGDTLELAGEISVGRDPMIQNGFMAMWAGGIKRLEVKAPTWMRGMLYMREAFDGGEMENLKANPTYEYLPGTDWRRSVSFHRVRRWREEVNRAANAGEVVNYGILMNVLSDNWILDEADEESSPMFDPSRVVNGVQSVRRFLSSWSE